MKVDGLMARNWLKGTAGDAMPAIPCAAGQNLRQLLRAIAAFFVSIRGSSSNGSSRCDRCCVNQLAIAVPRPFRYGFVNAGHNKHDSSGQTT